MLYTFNSDTPIFLQLASLLEDDIFSGVYEEGSAIPSTNELSVLLHINPATVLKAMNILLANNLIEKRRGIGMFVVKGARKRIKEKRKEEFNDKYIIPLLKEAEKLSIKKEDLFLLIEKGSKNENWMLKH